MEDAPDTEFIPLIPRPDIKDIILGEDPDGNVYQFEANLDNTQIILHKNGYERMDHVFVRLLGSHGLRLFKIASTPVGQYFTERGYDIVIRQYPNEETAAEHIELEVKEALEELENDKGHELDWDE